MSHSQVQSGDVCLKTAGVSVIGGCTSGWNIKINIKLSDAVGWQTGERCSYLLLSVSGRYLKAHFIGVPVIAAVQYLRAGTTFHLIYMTFHRQPSVTGPRAVGRAISSEREGLCWITLYRLLTQSQTPSTFAGLPREHLDVLYLGDLT